MSNWRTSTGATEHVADLLKRAGIPLEVQVSGLCRRFCQRYDGYNGIRVSTMRVVYADNETEMPAREVDQSIQLDKDIELTDSLGIRLRLRIPIECKHRKNLEVFGFGRPRQERVSTTLPFFSDHAGAALINQLAYSEPHVIQKARICALSLLEIEGNNKDRIHEEQLIEKAGGAIYDFIRTVEFNEASLSADALIKELGYIDKFRSFIRNKNIHWFGHFRKFIRALPTAEIDAFNARKSCDGRLFVEVSTHVPIICVNGPLYLVPCTRRGRIRRFDPIPLLVTGLRLKDWPGKLWPQFCRRRPEALIAVTNVNGIEAILESCLQWYERLEHALVSADATTRKRALFEGSLYRSLACGG